MPIYEYRCDQCGHQFEVIQKFSDHPLEECAQCRGRLSKLISQTSFQLKGSGWYITDYARKSGSADSSKETKSEAPSKETKSEAPSVAKADSKSETKSTSTSKTETSTSSVK